MRRLLTEQAGFTLIELMVASVLLAIGVGGTLAVVSSGNHANDVSHRNQLAIGVGERELERFADLDYAKLSLTSTPVTSPDTKSPANRISGTNVKTETGSYEPMVIGGANAAVDPGPSVVNEGGVTSYVYRFVSWVDAPSYSGCVSNCSNTHDYKRLTVVVQTKNPNSRGFSKYIIVSNLRIDPLLGPNGQVSQPPDPNPTQAHDNFYLYDSKATSCGTNSYSMPSSNHSTHDTSGVCASAQGKYPDLMGTEAPPNPVEPDLPPLYKYSTDVSGTYNGGIALQKSTDCTQNAQSAQQIHSWTSDVVSNATYQMTGKMSFDFWGNLIDSEGTGKICVWVYDRAMSGATPTDTLIASSSYSLENWPTEPTNLSFTFSHTNYSLAAGRRLRLVVTTSSQSAGDIQLIFDHPAAPSFLQIRTTTPISQ